ncbi:MAG: nitroreductase [Planctomycetaceae bacterium]|nr:nitroreductase [Planctomycetaceae bacterium]
MHPADIVSQNLRSRRTVGAFRPDLVDPAIVQQSLELACWAPNHRRTEPWRFHLIGPETQRRIVDLNGELVAEKKGPEAAAAKRRQWAAIPGWLAVTCLRSEDPLLAEEDYAACCCAVQNLQLALWSRGIGAKWSTGDVTRRAEFYHLLHVDPAAERTVGLIWYGLPEAVPQQTRRPVEDVIRRLP